MIDELFLLSRHFLQAGYREYKRNFLLKLREKDRLSVVVGQRGVGKTTAMIQVLHEATKGNLLSNEHLYVQTDHFVVGTMKIYEIVQSFVALGGKVVCFDEIHKYQGWSREIKSMYDTFKDLRILVTGSSALHIYKGSHDLSRRAIVHTLLGFSLREYIELKLGLKFPIVTLKELLVHHEIFSTDILLKVKEKGTTILRLFQEYLEHGFYPYYQDYSDNESFFASVERNIHTTIESDLLSLHPLLTGTSIRKIKKLLSFLAASVPCSPDMVTLKQICDIGDERTLKTYLSYLEDGGVISMCAPAGKKMNSLEKPEKIYLNNPNQINALRPTDRNIGTLRESFFVSMVKPLHEITIPAKGDFLVDNSLTFEIGGKSKGFGQIKDVKSSFRINDDLEIGINNTLPLWIFGFLY